MTDPPLQHSAVMVNESITAWYKSTAKVQNRDVAQEAYEDAIEYLRKELDGNKKELDAIEAIVKESHTRTSNIGRIHDIRRIVQKAKVQYESRYPRSRCARLLSKLSSRIMHYSTVLDMLSQHHPEYVALAWGALKFVLMGVIHHAQFLSLFSQALLVIEVALKEAELDAELYPTDTMKEAISQLYAHIMLFFQRAVKWYRGNRLNRIITAVINPPQLEYEETARQIKQCAETVRDIAGAASRAEMRHVHAKVDQQSRQLHEMQASMKEMQMKLDERHSQLMQVGTTHRAITERIDLNIDGMRPRLLDIQFSHILKALRPQRTPEQTLHRVQSLAKRNSASQLQAQDSPELLQSFTKWVSEEGSSLFVVGVGPRSELEAKSFAAHVIGYLQTTDYAVFWHLSQSGVDENAPSVTAILKSLLFQALSCNPNILQTPEEFNISKFETEHSESEWQSLTSKIFSRLSKCFIIIEAEDLFKLHRGDAEWVLHFLQTFHELIQQAKAEKSSLKVLLINHQKVDLSEHPEAGSWITSTVQARPPIPPRLRRKRGYVVRGPGWRDVKVNF